MPLLFLTAQSAFHISEYIYSLHFRLHLRTLLQSPWVHFIFCCILYIVQIELKSSPNTPISLNTLENWFRWTAQKNGMYISFREYKQNLGDSNDSWRKGKKTFFLTIIALVVSSFRLSLTHYYSLITLKRFESVYSWKLKLTAKK